MKANELMIGDWVLVNGTSVQVEAIDENGFIAYFNSNAEGLLAVDKFEPIPLTAEILEKNGFLPSFEMGHETLCLVSSEYSVYYRPDDTYLYVFKRDNEHGEGDFIIRDHRSINTKYVHELQHALCSCDLTDLADNFKI